MTKGTRVQFIRKNHIERYGIGGTVTNVQSVKSRPFGTITTLIDIKTDTGIDLQWPLSWVMRDTYLAS
jgi:hypothetical protein